ncbi:MAG: tRNA uridine(34) 5-carboxymethylaminomethyl modification radical SAM/GNAT enzyme Elp3 [Anaerolineae bacterium]|nr:tRNA uridine(34) 5-carboxymethylaminomethyl modification radical SAM/GNAT enzyme Elp3 [Anaerolineae bacterium]
MAQREADLREAALRALAARADRLTERRIQAALRRYPRPDGGLFTRDQLLRTYHRLCEAGQMTFDARLAQHLRRKPTRTISGVAPVTVLTGPQACRGTCIYCPDVPNAPKSYLPDEPGVQRARRFAYDPFGQTEGRIRAFGNIGHATDKVELLILGGTWSDYPADYQTWFVRRCLDAMNGVASPTLAEAQQANESAPHRNVGIVIETRPDCITPAEVCRLRELGVTKVQLGAQSLDDHILTLNRRGHTVDQTRAAVRRLRLAGFKIALHWMPNLLGATLQSDQVDFERLWDDPALCPDELKIYPCSLLPDTELYGLWQAGDYQPYDEDTLTELLIRCKVRIPPYCRLNRLMRDIPAPYIAAGVTRSNLRQVIQQRMAQDEAAVCRCIRCREVRGEEIDLDTLRFTVTAYDTDATQEHFLAYETPEGHLAAFLRLSFLQVAPELPVLEGSAMVRELHVYGPALALGARREGRPQHIGLGTELLERARAMARAAGYARLAVIAAVGTRGYYRERGFELAGTYMVGRLDEGGEG